MQIMIIGPMYGIIIFVDYISIVLLLVDFVLQDTENYFISQFFKFGKVTLTGRQISTP